MRYSRINKRQTKKRYATLLLIVLLGFVILYIAFAGTLGKFVSNLITPFLSGNNQEKAPEKELEDPVLTIPVESAKPVLEGEKTTDSLKANAQTMYTVQMGAFSDGENAESYANELKSLGGAGYILHDDYYRVLAVGFQSEEDAKKVKTELNDNGMESHVYKLTTAGADMKITATEENVTAIRSAYEIWEEKYLSLEELIIDLDSGKINTSDAYDKVKSIKSDMEEIRASLHEMNTNQNNNSILTGLASLYDNACQSLDKILSQNGSDKVAISSDIKYTYIDMLMQYKDYMEQITQ